MSNTEETIRKAYLEIQRDVRLVPIEFERFKEKLLGPPDRATGPVSSEQLHKRDIAGVYIALGAQLGKPEYIEYMYRTYKDALTAAARRYFPGDESRAEDVVHDVFASTNWGSFRGTGSLKGWLRAVTVNRCLDLIRSQKIYAQDRGNREHENGTNPELLSMSIECRKNLMSSVRDGLAVIASEQKNLLVFMYVEGVRVRDLARTYGTSPATVSRRLKTAREALERAIMGFCKKNFSMDDEEIRRCLDLIFGTMS